MIYAFALTTTERGGRASHNQIFRIVVRDRPYRSAHNAVLFNVANVSA